MNPRRFFVGRAVGFLVVLIVAGGIWFLTSTTAIAPNVNVDESATYIEQKSNLIRLESPLPNAEVTSPLTIKGEARGNWYFEASFPVSLVDWDGKIIAQSFATAQGEWMTTEFVPFTATLTFDTTDISGNYSNRGALILQKDNPSGLPEHDDALEIPVYLK